MIGGLRVLREALKDVWQRGYAYIWANMAFAALCLPVFTIPAAFSALMRVGHAAHTQPHETDLDLLWQTFRENLWRALPWGLAHTAFAIVNFGNLFLYEGPPGVVTDLLRAIWFSVGLIWAGVVLFTWPIYYEMAEPTLLGATRNAFIMVAQNPFFTLILLTGITFLSAVSMILFAAWVLLTWGTIAAIANTAVLDRLNIYRSRAQVE
ncbi:MAG: hypothetical protein ACOCX3_00615 [Chloroflexota bacterium]